MKSTAPRTPHRRHLPVIPGRRRPFSARAALLALLWLVATAAAAQRPHHTLPLAPLLRPETTDAGTLLVSDVDADGARVAFALVRPDVPLSWADGAGREAFLAQAVASADAAVQAGRTGLALDIEADSPRHAVTWAGYDLDAAPPDAMETTARRFGRRLRQAIHARAEQADRPLEILCIEADAEATGVLWYAFFEGLVDGAPSGSGPVHLITQSPSVAADPLACIQATAELRRRLRWYTRLDDAVHEAVRIGMAVRFDAGAPGALPLHLAARCYSETYALYDGPSDDAPWAPETLPFDPATIVRIGPWIRDDLIGYALRDEEGAALILWTGLPEPLRIPNRDRPVTVTDLASGDAAEMAPEEGGVTIPSRDGPVLIRPLPMQDFGLPACLWVDLDAGGFSNALECAWGLTNRTGFALTGSVAATVSRHVSIRPNVQPLDLGPSDDVIATGIVRGAFRPGGVVEISLSIHAPEAPAIAGLFRFPCYQRATASARLRSPIAAAPLLLPREVDPDHGPQIVAASSAGEIVCLRADGAVRWTHRRPAPFTIGPALLRDWQGAPLILTCDDAGTIEARHPSGVPAWSTDLGGPPSVGPIGVGHLHGFPGEEIVIPRRDGTVAVFLNTGQLLRKLDANGRNPRPTLGPASAAAGADVYVIAEGDEAVLTCFERGEREKWAHTIRMTPACAPLHIPARDDEGRSVVAVGSTRGTIQVRDAAAGEVLAERRIPGATPIAGLTAVDLGPEIGPILVATSESGVHGYALDLEPLWSRPLPSAAPACVAPLVDIGPGLLVPGADGALHLLTATGDPIWTNPEATGAIGAAPAAGPPDLETGAVTAAYVSTDGGLRVLPIEMPEW